MTYSVKEIFYTLQGEGFYTGRAAVFLRFAGCNLWTGREQDRRTAVCQFCDTDFIGMDGENGGRYDADALAQKAKSVWKGQGGKPFIVCTGGEPLLQLDKPLIDALHNVGFEIAVETNGTQIVPDGIDWVCVSPKSLELLKVFSGDELKLVYRQDHLLPEQVEHFNFKHFYLQPMDGAAENQMQKQAEMTQLAVEYCLQHPQWTLSLQTHKIIGIA